MIATLPATAKANTVTVNAEVLKTLYVKNEITYTTYGTFPDRIYSTDRLSVRRLSYHDPIPANVKWITFYPPIAHLNDGIEFMFSRDGVTVEKQFIKMDGFFDLRQFPSDLRWITVSNFDGDMINKSKTPINDQIYRYSTDGITILEGEQVPANALWATLFSYKTTIEGNPASLIYIPEEYTIDFIPVGLKSLQVNHGTLSPIFSSNTEEYSIDVGNAVTLIDLTPTVFYSTTKMEVNGASIASDVAISIPLNVGANTITIIVTAQDGTTKSYTITVTRQSSNISDLSNLSLNTGKLSPAFSSETTRYTANVLNSVASIDVTSTVTDSTATVAVNGIPIGSGNPLSLPLNVGVNTITIIVTAQDGTTKSYTISVTRQSSNNADLGNLTLNTGKLSPAFSSETTSYTVNVPNSVASIDMTPTVADSTASIVINGTSKGSGNATSIPLNIGVNTINIIVTAQSSITKTYVITVTRPPYSNANLKNLTLNNGTLAPVFSSGTTSYTASVPNSVASIDLTPTVADHTATVTVNGVPTDSGKSATINLALGANTIPVVVTAQDGTTNSYIITVTRNLASSNANLKNLTLNNGTLTPVFSSGTTSYTASVPNSVASIDVTPTVADHTAIVSVNGTTIASGNSKNIQLNVGSNIITTVVHASDGSTINTYTITVNRSLPYVPPTEPTIPAVDEPTIPVVDKPQIPKNAEEITERFNVNSKKVWTITFNVPIMRSSVTRDSIFVIDQDGIRTSTNITFGKRNEIILTPSQPYKAGQSYILYIDKTVQQTSGKFLVTPYRMKFTISK